MRELSEALGVVYLPEFSMPREEDFVHELSAVALRPPEREMLLDKYAAFRRWPMSLD